ncbi:MAG: hypothetical protein IJB30_08945, partial [Clostridia bacterium]|nr:hypothetical protein [Clostridia bacterium]
MSGTAQFKPHNAIRMPRGTGKSAGNPLQFRPSIFARRAKMEGGVVNLTSFFICTTQKAARRVRLFAWEKYVSFIMAVKGSGGFLFARPDTSIVFARRAKIPKKGSGPYLP